MTTGWIIAYALLALTVVFLTLVVIGILRRVAPLLDQRAGNQGLELGGLRVLATVPSIELVDRDGGDVRFPDGLSETVIVLLLESSCAPCRTLVEALTRVDGEVGGLPVVALLDDSSAARAFPLPPTVDFLYGRRDLIANAFATAATPYAFAVAAGGVVLEKRVPRDLDDLRLMALHQKGGEVPQELSLRPVT